MAEAAFKRSGKTVGVATGFVDLDQKLGGLHPSDLVILGGRPSMGKSALATNIAFNAAKAYRAARTADGRSIAEDGAVVGFFSLEMSAEQLATRILGEESGISSDRIRRGDVSHRGFRSLRPGEPPPPGAAAVYRRHPGAQRFSPTTSWYQQPDLGVDRLAHRPEDAQRRRAVRFTHSSPARAIARRRSAPCRRC